MPLALLNVHIGAHPVSRVHKNCRSASMGLSEATSLQVLQSSQDGFSFLESLASCHLSPWKQTGSFDTVLNVP